MEEHPTLRITAELKSLALIRKFVLEAGQRLGAETEPLHDMVHAVDEAATNILEHGYKEKTGPIEIEISQQGRALRIRIRDQAPQFDPTNTARPDLSLPLHRRPVGGLGIHLIREFVDEIAYEHRNGVNELTLVKRAILPGESEEVDHEYNG